MIDVVDFLRLECLLCVDELLSGPGTNSVLVLLGKCGHNQSGTKSAVLHNLLILDLLELLSHLLQPQPLSLFTNLHPPYRILVHFPQHFLIAISVSSYSLCQSMLPFVDFIESWVSSSTY